MTAKNLKTLIDTLNQNGSYLIKVDKYKYGIDYIIADKKISFPREHFCMPDRVMLNSLQLLKIRKSNTEPFTVKYVYDYDEKTKFRSIQINDTKESLEQLLNYVSTMSYSKPIDNNLLSLFKKLKLRIILDAYTTTLYVGTKINRYGIYEIAERIRIKPDFVLN